MIRLTWSDFFLTLTLMISLTGSVFSQQLDKPEPPIGKVQYEISCSDEVGPAFNEAVSLLHHMTYPQAKASFEKIAAIDPECAIAYWGIGMTLFQPLWPTRPGPNELQEGWEMVLKAKSLTSQTKREQLFIATTEAFFRNPKNTDYRERIRSWADATEKLYREFPDDTEVKAFFALSLLAAGQLGSQGLDYNNRAAQVALSIHATNPLHPGAIHYLIHANDIQGREHGSLDIVRSYHTIAPHNPHALHMPTHIFIRLGNWQEAIDGNLMAAEAALLHSAGDNGQYVWDEYSHALEYLLYAYLQQGADESAFEQLRLLYSRGNLQPTFKTAFNLASMPARYALERKAWKEAATLSPQAHNEIAWDRYPWPEAITWFARGIGAIHEGDHVEARNALKRIEELEETTDKVGEELFRNQIRILRLGVSSWISHFENNEEQAHELMQAAADLEVSTPKHPVTPAPTLPAHELLGELLMEQNKPLEALDAFRKSLKLYPKRFNSLLGAARAAQSLNHQQIAREFYTGLLEIGATGSDRSGLAEARFYLSSDFDKN